MGVRNQHAKPSRGWSPRPSMLRFTTEIQQGLNCSPFEAEAVLDVGDQRQLEFPPR